ncbi:MAG: hypothetical protein M1816_006851 [Peltula sp. TS41687]|nr:MAG: hypothetical protein M1816_006851 [Peltula sp. TS41687]
MGSRWVYNASPAVNAQSNFPTIIAVCICLTVIMIVMISMRCYVRMIMLRSVGADDWTILFSAICSIIYNALAIAQSRWGLGLPIAQRPAANTLDYKALNYAGRPFYMAGITGFKVALCLAYLRIVPPRNKRIFKPLIWFVLISCVLAHLAGTLVLILQCNPVRKSFYPTTPGHCLPDPQTFYALAVITIFFDCVIFLLPIPLLARVQINMRRKIALIGVFLLGLFTTVCSIMRLVQIRTISKNGNSTMLVLWGTIEMNVGIALTCLPTLTPLFHFFREKTAHLGYKPNKGDNSGSSRTATMEHPLENLVMNGGHHPPRLPKPAWKGGRETPVPTERSSQESILGIESVEQIGSTTGSNGSTLDGQPSEMGGITRTTYVGVQIDQVHSASRPSLVEKSY